VVQASLQLQQLVHRLQDAIAAALNSRSFKQLRQQIEAAKGSLLGVLMLVILLIWNWQLVLSLGVGALAVILIYLAHQGELNIAWLGWSKLWNRSNRALTLAIAGGGIAATSTYLVTAIWQEAGGSWITTGIILQGLATLFILLLLVWQAIDRFFKHQDDHNQKFDALLANLANPDPLKRLIAVRQITQWVKSPSMSQAAPPSMPPSDLVDCFRLMLNRETEPVICSALLESLQVLSQIPQLQQGSQPWSGAVSVKQSKVKVHRQHAATERLD
jgi:hypothetical protein